MESKLEGFIRESAFRKVPGLINALDLLCIYSGLERSTTLFLREPGKLYAILKELYGHEAAGFILINVFLKPLLSFLNKVELLPKASYLMEADVNEFAELIKDLLKCALEVPGEL
ncbi:MAG: hypothetical protein N3E36_04670 [Sulfolobales archaeon]|nr:hypothetical protein [Sulfolobales archaeon]MCX8199309.1 hypothetical protein [Sulfolobales archaeon]MDW8170377.1 hypothetical protein [Desulfurococcaceae archaeon]